MRLLAIVLLITSIVGALCAPLIAPYDPYQHHPEQRLHPPSKDFIFGSDHLGRDILSRVLFGAREMLFTLSGALIFALCIGGGLGLLTISTMAAIDGIMTLLFDVVLAFPVVLLAIVLIGSFGASLFSLIVTLGVIFVPVIARQVRSMGRDIIAKPYIESVRSAGGGTGYIIFRHIIPALCAPILHFLATIAVLMIGISSSLSFLGLARRPPTADWGLMLRDARSYLLHAPWMLLFPGIAIICSGLLLYFVGAARNTPRI